MCYARLKLNLRFEMSCALQAFEGRLPPVRYLTKLAFASYRIYQLLNPRYCTLLCKVSRRMKRPGTRAFCTMPIGGHNLISLSAYIYMIFIQLRCIPVLTLVVSFHTKFYTCHDYFIRVGIAEFFMKSLEPAICVVVVAFMSTVIIFSMTIRHAGNLYHVSSSIG